LHLGIPGGSIDKGTWAESKRGGWFGIEFAEAFVGPSGVKGRIIITKIAVKSRGRMLRYPENEKTTTEGERIEIDSVKGDLLLSC